MDAQLEKELGLDRSVPDVFAVEEDVILQRFQTFSAVDPFPDVPAALLNSADILDYVAATGMIHPFRIDMTEPSTNLKPGTYGVPLLGKFVYWEQAAGSSDGSATRDGATYTKQVGELGEKEELRLRANTITYVELEPFFRLPRYIAARYNLNIHDIYRGMLVGTGPLVDPGFEGRLYVPLHNLTSNEYTIVGGEPLVWMEFAKLSVASDGWRSANADERPDRRGSYIEFPPQKKQLELEDYLRQAHPVAIVSSIPAAIGQAQQAAEHARSEAEKAREDAESSKTFIRNIGIGAAIAVVLALGAVLVPTWALIHDANERQDHTGERVQELEQSVSDEQAQNVQQAAQIARLRAQLLLERQRGR